MLASYRDHGIKADQRLAAILKLEGLDVIPSTYADFIGLDQPLRQMIGMVNPLVGSDDYEHFMAVLPHRRYAAHHVLLRKQLGGFTVAAGFWRWLEFLSHRITAEKVNLTASFFSGKHNGYPRQFNREYWMHVVEDFGGYLPLRIEVVGEGATFTGVPFPVAQVYGETPAVWLNEPLYIQIGHLSHIATVAAQFAEALGDPWRFIEVMFRALHNQEESADVLLAMLIGGGIISTSNDLGAFINGAPFKPSGTTGHCWYQQWPTMREALRTLLSSPLGPYATVLLDLVDHDHGFNELRRLIEEEGLAAPFAVRPDSGNTLELGLNNLTVLQADGTNINVVLEDGYRPDGVRFAEMHRQQLGLDPKRMFYGAGGAFMGPRSDLEAAYKACAFHDGTVAKPEAWHDTMKICLDDESKASFPGLVEVSQNPVTGIYMVGRRGEAPQLGYQPVYQVLYDGLTKPGEPYFNPKYAPQSLATSEAITEGTERSLATRKLLSAAFTTNVTANRMEIALSPELKEKRRQIVDRAKFAIKEQRMR